jgi:hypothetical protein
MGRRALVREMRSTIDTFATVTARDAGDRAVIEARSAVLLIARNKMAEAETTQMDFVMPTKGSEHGFEFKCGTTTVVVKTEPVDTLSSSAVELGAPKTKGLSKLHNQRAPVIYRTT